MKPQTKEMIRQAQTMRDAERHQRDLDAAIAGLTSAKDDEARRRCTAAIQESSAGLKSCLQALSNPPACLEEEQQPEPAPSKKAEEASAIPELLEASIHLYQAPKMILLNLNIRDLLTTAMQVNKTFSTSIANSPKLQTRLGFRANTTTTHFSIPLLGDTISPCEFPRNRIETPFPGLEALCTWTQPSPRFSSILPREIELTLTLSTDANGNLPRVGTKAREILVGGAASGPLTSMSAHFLCCTRAPSKFPSSDHVWNTGVHTGIVREQGLRIGDLLEFAEKAVQEHRLCPDARPELLDKNGFVSLEIGFSRVVKVRVQDPVWVDRMRGLEECRRLAGRVEKEEEMMVAFTGGKQSARDAGEQIPTLEEWRASLPAESPWSVGHGL